MTESSAPPDPEPPGCDLDRATLDGILAALRPRLHRYCARMTGSVIDGEDVLQETILKAIEAFDAAGPLRTPEAWLFRIAHNTALDFLRRRARQASGSEEEMEAVPDPSSDAEQRWIAAASLHCFMRLPPAQRSCVILSDVIGYSAEEVGAINAMSIAAVKAALHRGRASLRALAAESEDRPVPLLGAAERQRLALYVDCFNARDFDRVRDMLAEDVRLELVNRLKLKGKPAVAPYFHRYAEAAQWRFAAGLVEGRPAVLVFDTSDPAAPARYFVLIDWAGDRIIGIRDFLFAPYAMEGAAIARLDGSSATLLP